MNPIIRRALQRTATFEVRDYIGLLRVHEDYKVVDLKVPEDSWLADEFIADLQLRSHEGVVILGIRRADGSFVGAPTGDDRIHTGDKIIAYGRESRLREVAERTREEKVTEDDYQPLDL